MTGAPGEVLGLHSHRDYAAGGPENVVAGAQNAAPIPDPEVVPADGTNI
jgi:hypothetical protein